MPKQDGYFESFDNTDFFSDALRKESEGRAQMAEEALVTPDPIEFDRKDVNLGSPEEVQNNSSTNQQEMPKPQFQSASYRFGSPTHMPGGAKLDAKPPMKEPDSPNHNE